jgi:hypothetical protein
MLTRFFSRQQKTTHDNVEKIFVLIDFLRFKKQFSFSFSNFQIKFENGQMGVLFFQMSVS